MHRSLARTGLWVLTLSLGLTAACPRFHMPLGDCFPDVKATVNIDDKIALDPTHTLYIEVVQHVQRTNAQNIPEDVTPRSESVTLEAGKRTYKGQGALLPEEGDTWVYAYIDVNGNQGLDSGDFYGVAANPVPGPNVNDCKDSEPVVTISQTYP